jgi:hypothetical protein
VTDSFNVQFLVGHEAHEAGISLLAKPCRSTSDRRYERGRKKSFVFSSNVLLFFPVFEREEVESVFEGSQGSRYQTLATSFLVLL